MTAPDGAPGGAAPGHPTLLAEPNGTIRMASASAARMLGLSGSDLEGRPLHELIASPGKAVIDALLGSLREPPALPARLAVTLRLEAGALASADLHLIWLAKEGTAARAAGGAESAGSILIDIHRVDAADHAPGEGAMARGDPSPASETEQAETTNDAALVCRGGIIVHAGEGVLALTGVEPRRLTGWNFRSLVAAEDLLPVIEMLRAVESGARPSGELGFHLLRAGSLPPLEVAARARRTTLSGSPAVLLGLRDISTALRAARAADERLARLDAALAATSEAILILGRPEDQSPVILASPLLKTVFGVEGSRWVGRPFWDFWKELRPLHAYPEDEERVWWDLIQDAEGMRVDMVPMASPAGRTLERFSGPMRNADGEIIGRICTFRDVTARSHVEAELHRSREEARRAREELEVLHEDLRLANEGLEKRMAEMQALNKDLKILDEMKSNLLANVSHELQTPLVSIKGFTEMILKGRLGAVTPEQERGLQVALRNINRLIGLINNLLAFARSEGPETSLALEVFPLGPLVDEAVVLVRERAEGRKIAIATTLPAGDLLVRADREKVLQVFLNLLTNAVKYNKDGGTVRVEVEKGRRGTARIEVKDSGVGIPREALERIFDRYFQAGNIEGPREGAGIGLSITKDILRQHGCMIRADSEEGKGSVFSFTLPLDRKGRSEKSAVRAGEAASAAVLPHARISEET